MITVKNLSVSFATGNSEPTKALDNICLSVSAGEFVVLVGSNGSGKSTLLNALAGSIRINSGEIFFEDKKINHLKAYQRCRWIARVFQNPLSGTASDLTIIDNFRLASLRTHPKRLHRGITKTFINEVKEKISLLGLGLENKTDQQMGTLSGGQRQALTLIMAIMDDSKILLMDEPTAALDPKTAALLMQRANDIIAQFMLTTILVTHQIRDAHEYGNRIIQMKEGQIIRDLNRMEKIRLSRHDIYEWF